MLEFDAAIKHFGSRCALDGCTFTARPGRLTGFLGPNGAGKTTAMRAVFGLVELDAGTVHWRGTPVGPAQRARFGYMPEERGLYPRMRVRDQLVYLGRLCGLSDRVVGPRVDEWLERVGLADRGRDRLDALSHGNQQRVQLVAALVNQPELVILDEPFSGLDPIAITTLAGILEETAKAGAPCCSPATSSTSSPTCAKTWWSSTPGGSCWPERSTNSARRSRNGSWTSASGGRRRTGPASARADLVRAGDGQARLRLRSAADIGAVLTATAGRIEILSLSYQPPTLSELFRRAVAA